MAVSSRRMHPPACSDNPEALVKTDILCGFWAQRPYYVGLLGCFDLSLRLRVFCKPKIWGCTAVFAAEQL